MKRHQLCFAAIHLACIIVFLLGQAHCIPSLVFESASEAQRIEYVLNLVCVIQTMAVAVAAYYLPSRPVLRMVLLGLVICVDIACFYLIGSSTGLLCAAIAYLILLYCHATTLGHHRKL